MHKYQEDSGNTASYAAGNTGILDANFFSPYFQPLLVLCILNIE